jgi:hypothetical protein
LRSRQREEESDSASASRFSERKRGVDESLFLLRHSVSVEIWREKERERLSSQKKEEERLCGLWQFEKERGREVNVTIIYNERSSLKNLPM